MQLNEKVVLVTGASMGIGREIAHALVREGAQVIFAARSLERLREEVAAAGPEALALELDVTSEASVAAALDGIAARYGRLDAVVNNAGSGGPLQRWEASDSAATRAMFDVHLLGSERVMRAALPLMRRSGGGTIVNFASTLAWVAMPGMAAYNAAKAAVVMMSETLREELKGQGIDVRVFAPPHTSTESGKALPLKLPKIFEPAWVAQAFVRFLKGSKARALPGGNGSLLLLQRIAPRLAQRIMSSIGFSALKRLSLPAA